MAKAKTFLLVEDDAYYALFVVTEFEKSASRPIFRSSATVWKPGTMWRAWAGMRTAIGIRCPM